MTVRGAVEKTAISPQAAIKATVDNYLPVIARALPKHISPERFAGTVLTACRTNPELMRCEPTSVVAAAIKAAQLGLEPNDERQLCYLIPHGGKATFQLGYRGQIELARRSGAISRVVARTVHQDDKFDFAYGTINEGITHQPSRRPDAGPGIFWYAIAWAPDGSLMDFVVLNKADIEYHRSFSAQPNGPMWTKSFDAAARKTCIRELMKLLPQSPELADAMASDERSFRISEMGAETDELEPLPREHQAIDTVAMTDDDVAALAPEPITGR